VVLLLALLVNAPGAAGPGWQLVLLVLLVLAAACETKMRASAAQHILMMETPEFTNRDYTARCPHAHAAPTTVARPLSQA
jgi:hypothetical protein